MKIAVTINVGNFSIWSNGVNQNAIYLAMLLKDAGHDAHLLYSTYNKDNRTKASLDTLNLDVNHIDLKDAFNEPFDVIIQLGLSIEEYMLNAFKKVNPDLKFVSYECGNHFMIDSEKIIYGQHESKNTRKITYASPDQIWCIPQMEHSNLSYYEFKRKCDKGTVVPFIWDPIALELDAKQNNYTTYTKRDLKNIAVMEPNISMMKNCIFPIVALEKFVNESDYELDRIYLVGASKLKDREPFKDLIRPTELLKKKLMTAEARIQTGRMINNYADIVFSWQWENNLNYLYLDVAWMGWPVIHNATLCQDIGYYYEAFDARSGVSALNRVLKNHNNDNDYLEINRKKIKRYTKENKQIVKIYNEMLHDLVNDKFKKRKYNWKTNTTS
jgi:hypothetical protein